MSLLHIPIVRAHDVSKQIPWEKNFPSGWKCYKTIDSYVSCVFIEIWSTWEVWRALKKLELPTATPRATLTHLLCSPNFLHASYLDGCTLTYEPIVNCSLGNCWIIIGLLFVLRFLLSNSVASNLYFRRYSTFTFVELLFSTCTTKYSKLDKIFLQKSTFTTACDEAQTC